MRSETESIVARATLYNLWNMVPWFIIKQTQTETAKLTRADPPTVLLENGSMVYNQGNTNRNGNNHLTCRPPYSFAREWFHGS